MGFAQSKQYDCFICDYAVWYVFRKNLEYFFYNLIHIALKCSVMVGQEFLKSEH